MEGAYEPEKRRIRVFDLLQEIDAGADFARRPHAEREALATPRREDGSYVAVGDDHIIGEEPARTNPVQRTAAEVDPSNSRDRSGQHWLCLSQPARPDLAVEPIAEGQVRRVASDREDGARAPQRDALLGDALGDDVIRQLCGLSLGRTSEVQALFGQPGIAVTHGPVVGSEPHELLGRGHETFCSHVNRKSLSQTTLAAGGSVWSCEVNTGLETLPRERSAPGRLAPMFTRVGTVRGDVRTRALIGSDQSIFSKLPARNRDVWNHPLANPRLGLWRKR